jgi:hypothetical protein
LPDIARTSGISTEDYKIQVFFKTKIDLPICRLDLEIFSEERESKWDAHFTTKQGVLEAK